MSATSGLDGTRFLCGQSVVSIASLTRPQVATIMCVAMCMMHALHQYDPCPRAVRGQNLRIVRMQWGCSTHSSFLSAMLRLGEQVNDPPFRKPFLIFLSDMLQP